jgi:hypothetical protein
MRLDADEGQSDSLCPSEDGAYGVTARSNALPESAT